MSKDNIYNKKRDKQPFKFNQEVAEVFDDMIARSVPYYDDLQRLIVQMVGQYYKSGTIVYDLGCSTGTSSLMLAKNIEGIDIIAIDNSLEMIEEAKVKTGEYSNVKYVKEDISIMDFNQSSVILLSYVMQFIDVNKRIGLLSKIYNSLLPGGLLIMSEKIKFDNFNQEIINLHEQFKRANKYSDLEIKQKRDALDNVLIPHTKDENIKLIKSAGFKRVEVFFQYLNFCGFMAVK